MTTIRITTAIAITITRVMTNNQNMTINDKDNYIITMIATMITIINIAITMISIKLKQ